MSICFVYWPTLFRERLAPKSWFPYDRRRSQTIADRKSQITDDRKESCFHMIADDRKRSQSRLLHTFRTAEVSKFNTRKKSQQTKWRTSREKFCCKQIDYSFSNPILKFSWYISLRIQKVAFSIASDHTQFLCCGRLHRRRRKLSFPRFFPIS